MLNCMCKKTFQKLVTSLEYLIWINIWLILFSLKSNANNRESDEVSNAGDLEPKTSELDILLAQYQQQLLNEGTHKIKSKTPSKTSVKSRAGKNRGASGKISVSQLVKPRLPPSLKVSRFDFHQYSNTIIVTIHRINLQKHMNKIWAIQQKCKEWLRNCWIISWKKWIRIVLKLQNRRRR